jgi:3-hydroxyacyl-[acyl-carrier-protein] dehydratase
VDITKIQKILPHRYPFLLVDRVVEVEAGKRLKAYKNVTANEEFFNGHFPGHPVMPGVLIVEAMAQAAALLAHESESFDKDGRVIYLMGLDNVRFRRPVVPGDRLDIEVTVTRHKGAIWKQSATATVDGKRAAECDLLATVKDKDS